MWSDRYFYFNSWFDTQLSKSFNMTELNQFLKSRPELEENGTGGFRNNPDFAFLTIDLLYTRDKDNWSNSNTHAEKLNMIAIVCGRTHFEELKILLMELVTFVNGDLVLEETDEGLEDFVVWNSEHKKADWSFV